MVLSEVVIRLPVPADFEALARCHLACWAEAYADLADPERLAPFLADVDGATARWREALAGPARVRVGDDGCALVGFASVRPATPDAPAHLGAIYVRRAFWSTGLGQRLLDATLGDEAATLDVYRDNDRARRFYARNGFVPDGTESEEPHWGGIEIGMVRPARR